MESDTLYIWGASMSPYRFGNVFASVHKLYLTAKTGINRFWQVTAVWWNESELVTKGTFSFNHVHEQTTFYI